MVLKSLALNLFFFLWKINIWIFQTTVISRFFCYMQWGSWTVTILKILVVFITSLGKFFITPNMLGTILSIYKWIKYGPYAEGTKKKYITQAMYVIVFIYLLKIHTFIYLLHRQFKSLRGTASQRFCSQWLWQKDFFEFSTSLATVSMSVSYFPHITILFRLSPRVTMLSSALYM